MDNGQLVERKILHVGDAELNCMILQLTQGLAGEPHYNQDREESVCVLKGEVDVLIFKNGKIIKHKLDSEVDQVLWIPGNEIHVFNVLSNEAIVLENIAGRFKEGCCKNFRIEGWHEAVKSMYRNEENEYYYDVSS